MPRYRTNAELVDMLAEEMAISDKLRRDNLELHTQTQGLRVVLARLRSQLCMAQSALGRVRRATAPVQGRLAR